MQYKSNSVRDRNYSYFGCLHSTYQNDSNCSRRFIKEAVLNDIVFQSVKQMVALGEKAVEIVSKKKEKSEIGTTVLVKRLADLQKKLEKCNSEKFGCVQFQTFLFPFKREERIASI